MTGIFFFFHLDHKNSEDISAGHGDPACFRNQDRRKGISVPVRLREDFPSGFQVYNMVLYSLPYTTLPG